MRNYRWDISLPEIPKNLDYPWHCAKKIAATQRSLPVHPAQLYSTFNSLLITGLLLSYFFVPHLNGRVFALMLMLEGPTRFILEMLRVEPPVLGPMSLSMVIGAILLIVGIVLWFVFGLTRDNTYQMPMLAPQAG